MTATPELVEARLRASEARLRAILDSEPECVKTVSLDGRVLEMNPAGLRMLEADDAAEVLGREILERVHPEDRAAFRELHRQAAGGGSGQIQFRVVGLKGTVRWMETHSVALRAEDGAVVSVLSVTRDVTERMRAENALSESHRLLQAIIDNNPARVFWKDRDSRYLGCNPAYARDAGLDRPQDLVGKDDFQLLLWKDEAETYRAADRQVMASGIPMLFYEERIATANGQQIWVRASKVPLRDERGETFGVLGTYEDITEHRQAEEALRRSEIQLRSFIELAPAEMAMFDNDMICLAASQHWIGAHGRGRPTPVGISHYELNPDLPERWKEIHRRGLAGESMACEEDLWVRADGTQQWLRWSMEPWRDTQGAIGGIVLLLEDISARKQAEAAILTEKSFSEAMLGSLPGIFYLFDQTGRFLRWNSALETVSEYSATEIAAMSPLDFFTGEEVERIAETVRKVFESGRAEVEVALTSKSGREIPHYFVGTRVSWNGAPCCIGMGIDITERKNLETELRQSQKIEAIGRLAGGVAHDFNNILGVILGYGELAESELTAESPVREYVTEMVQAAQRAATLTRQLQAFSRKQVLQPRRIDLNDLVATAHKMLDRVIGEDLSLVVRPAPQLGTVLADPGQIDQILLNLAINARDAMPGGGTLTLETADVDLREVDATADRPAISPGRYVMLAVSDTGVGMDAETQRRLFEPFFTTKPVGQGTGLGLATVYGIVKQSGGYIWVYSEPGLGTTFKIYLPRVDELPEGTPPGDSSTIIGGGSETILLVEDNPALREMIRRRLAGRGYTVLLAGDGDEALAMEGARSEPIDLLLTDVVMPNLGGAELARRMGALRPGLRVLFMSGYTDGAIVQHGVLEEGVVLLEKPFSGERLLRAVRVALDRPDASGFWSESAWRP